MEKLKRVVIKEEYVVLTEDTLEAIILNQMLYWSERVKDFDKFIQEENERTQKFYVGEPSKSPKEIEFTHGWIYKKASELKEEIMATDSEKTINRKLNNLVGKGFLDRRNNPALKYDRTYQYRVNFPNIVKALIEKGYMIQDYKIDLNFVAEALKILNGQNDDSKQHEEESKRQIDDLKSQIDDLKSQIVSLKGQEVGAIPETTTETTTKTTTEKEAALSSNNLDSFFKSIKEDITEVSFNTWIKDLNIKQEGDKIIIEAGSKFIENIIKNKYLSLIKLHLKKCCEFTSIDIQSTED